jgi:hypothetical protein
MVWPGSVVLIGDLSAAGIGCHNYLISLNNNDLFCVSLYLVAINWCPSSSRILYPRSPAYIGGVQCWCHKVWPLGSSIPPQALRGAARSEGLSPSALFDALHVRWTTALSSDFNDKRVLIFILHGAPIISGLYRTHGLRIVPETWVTLLGRTGFRAVPTFAQPLSAIYRCFCFHTTMDRLYPIR